MFRKIALLLVVAVLPLTGCKKVKELADKRLHQATPEPTVAITATPTPATASEPKRAALPPPPPKPKINTQAEVVVLCYHRLEGRAGGINSIEPALFEQHMAEIKQSGIPVISMQDFLAWRRGEKDIPPKAILITLDDGYVSEVIVGVPILKKYGFPATFFVYLEYINKGGKSVTWAQLAELRDEGFEIGSHTVSHLDLRRKPAKWPGDYESWLKDELERSRKVLEEQLGIRCATIAYPFGNHNEKVQAATRAAGYEAAFTTYGARLGLSTNELTLGRYDVTAKMPGNQTAFNVAIAFTGMTAPSGAPVLAQDAAASMITEPMNGETVTKAQPVIKANLASMGDLDAGTVGMRISGLGLVGAKYDAASGNISFTPPQPLKVGTYRVIIAAKSAGRPVETGWTFYYSPDGIAPAAETEPQSTPLPARKKR